MKTPEPFMLAEPSAPRPANQILRFSQPLPNREAGERDTVVDFEL